MAFSEETLREAWRLARGRCECQRTDHGHGERCNRPLVWARLGYVGEGGWQAHAWDGEDDVANCEILCPDCYARMHRAED
ncbi:MAG: hypothetical protein ACE147_02740 [Candidatus Methylomirabilales bacterium]